MKPCRNCGHPLSNHQQECDKCESVQDSPVSVDQSRMRTTPKTIMALQVVFEIFDIVFSVFVFGIPISIVAMIVLGLILWSSKAIWVGCLVGFSTALLFVLIRNYFHNQIYRGPLS